MLRLVLAVALVAASAGHALAAPEAPEAALERGRVAYERGAYKETVDTVRPLLYPRIELASEDAVIEAHRLLALAHLFQQEEVAAEEEVKALLALRPTFELDPVIDPPVAVRFFQSVRAKQDEQLRALKQREAEERAAAERAAAEKRRQKATFIERGFRQNSRLVALLPFGAGQFQNGHTKLGIFFATSQLLMGALSLSCWAAVEAKWRTRVVPREEADTAAAVLNVQLVAGALFWGLYAASVIDAQVRFVPRRDVKERVLPAAKPKTAWVPSILIAPGYYGVGAGGVF